MSEHLVTPELLGGWPLPTLGSDSDKEARGRALIVGGGAEMPGAAVLAALGALRAGAGKLQVAAAAPVNLVIAGDLPEARVILAPGSSGGDLELASVSLISEFASRTDALVIGPGMPDEAVAGEILLGLAEAAPDCALVVDAAAMTGLSLKDERVATLGGRSVLTPHAGEMAGMLGCEKTHVLADPVACVRKAACVFRSVVALKGETTLIASPDGVIWRYENGPVGLATSGSGDVLAGVIGGLLARGAVPAQAAVWGVALHGEAGRLLSAEIGSLGFLAREIPPAIPRVMARLCGPV